MQKFLCAASLDNSKLKGDLLDLLDWEREDETVGYIFYDQGAEEVVVE